jgi:hypothetical protein
MEEQEIRVRVAECDHNVGEGEEDEEEGDGGRGLNESWFGFANDIFLNEQSSKTTSLAGPERNRFVCGCSWREEREREEKER